MKFPFRAAILIAVTLASTLAATGAPGFAIAPDKPFISAASLAVEPVTTATNASPTAIVPASDVADTLLAKIDASPSVNDAAQSDYATLTAAVAAQAHPESINDDLSCMAGAIYFEAKGEPLAGQLAVAHVILNRTKSGRFPKSICSVVTQRGQFSFVRGGRIPNVNRSNAAYLKALAVARVAIGKLWDSPAGNALYFHATSVSPRWRMARVAAIGHHVFYK